MPLLSRIEEWCPGGTSELEKGAFCVFSVHSFTPHGSETNASPLQISSRAFESTISAHVPKDHDETPMTKTADPEGNGAPNAADQSFDDFREDSLSTAQTLVSLVERQEGHTPPRHTDALPMPYKQKRPIHH